MHLCTGHVPPTAPCSPACHAPTPAKGPPWGELTAARGMDWTDVMLGHRAYSCNDLRTFAALSPPLCDLAGPIPAVWVASGPPYACACAGACARARVWACACLPRRMCFSAQVHVRVDADANVHTHGHTHAHALVPVPVLCTCMRLCVRICLGMCTFPRMCTCMRMPMCIRMRTCLCPWLCLCMCICTRLQRPGKGIGKAPRPGTGIPCARE